MECSPIFIVAAFFFSFGVICLFGLEKSYRAKRGIGESRRR